MRGFWICTTRRPSLRNAAPTAPPVPPQPITSPGRSRRPSPTAASGAGQVRAATQRQGARGSSMRSSGAEPGGLREPEGLGLQPGIGLGQNPAFQLHAALFRASGPEPQPYSASARISACSADFPSNPIPGSSGSVTYPSSTAHPSGKPP